MKTIISLVLVVSNMGCVAALGDFHTAPTANDAGSDANDAGTDAVAFALAPTTDAMVEARALNCIIIHAQWKTNNSFATSNPAVCPVGMYATFCGCDTSGFGVVPVVVPSNDAGQYATGDTPTECLCAIGSDDAGLAMGEIASVATCCSP